MSGADAVTVEFADDLWAAGFTSIPNIILRDSSLSRDARILLAVLMSYAWSGECHPSQDTLGAALGMSGRAVRTYLRELEDVGLVETVKGGYQQTNTYRLLVPNRKHASTLTDRKHASAKEDTVERGPTTTPTPSTRAPAREAAPDPKPPSAQPIVAAWFDARRAAGKGEPSSMLRGQVARTVKALLKEGTPAAIVTEAAERLARSSYGPGLLAKLADDVTNGVPEQAAKRTTSEALAHSPFEGMEGL